MPAIIKETSSHTMKEALSNPINYFTCIRSRASLVKFLKLLTYRCYDVAGKPIHLHQISGNISNFELITKKDKCEAQHDTLPLIVL